MSSRDTGSCGRGSGAVLVHRDSKWLRHMRYSGHTSWLLLVIVVVLSGLLLLLLLSLLELLFSLVLLLLLSFVLLVLVLTASVLLLLVVVLLLLTLHMAAMCWMTCAHWSSVKVRS